jgi:hypothetical protein
VLIIIKKKGDHMKFLILILLSSCFHQPDGSSLKFENTGLKSIAPQVSDPIPEGPITISYETLKTTFLEAKCFQCHRSMRTEIGFNKFLVPGEPEQTDLFNIVVEGSMPPAGKGDVLTTEELELLREYIISLKNPESN